jgi:hypothetical protein
MKRKGVNYDTGIQFSHSMSREQFDIHIVKRELEIIRQDLHCNAVRISGSDPDRMRSAAEEALRQGLEVWLSPHFPDKTFEETIRQTVRCAEMAEDLRRHQPDVVFILGCEWTIFMKGIVEGETLLDRIQHPSFRETIRSGSHNRPLNAFLREAHDATRQVFKGNITYASAPIESVDWNLFDFVSIDHYRGASTRHSFTDRLQPYFAWNKPVIITEVGCCTYQGAEKAGGMGFLIADITKHPKQLKGEYIRDEDLQARELTELLTLLDQTGVDGTFVYTFVAPLYPHREDPKYDLDMASYALVKSHDHRHGVTCSDLPWEPKKSFYAVARFFSGLKNASTEGVVKDETETSR